MVVLGPKALGPIPPDQFAERVDRSGIRLVTRSWYPVSERLMVVEEDARWPQDPSPARVATVFRVVDGKATTPRRDERGRPGPAPLLDKRALSW
ncbi:hypothetical protein [Amycolatopsis dongchuanensis]|uniref:Uncharacterized protein n=2 Tax=Amycolatopsis TaxID=1813 RepID=A0A1I3VN45_9PSEU|nr:hypothetical protein SAMN05421835_11168 [Amycolatopsis sacchari]